jgi:hypothetical protein
VSKHIRRASRCGLRVSSIRKTSELRPDRSGSPAVFF